MATVCPYCSLNFNSNLLISPSVIETPKSSRVESKLSFGRWDAINLPDEIHLKRDLWRHLALERADGFDVLILPVLFPHDLDR